MSIAKRLRATVVLAVSLSIAAWVVWSAQRAANPPSPAKHAPALERPQSAASATAEPVAPPEPVFLSTSKSAGRIPPPPPAPEAPASEEPVFLSTSKSAGRIPPPPPAPEAAAGEEPVFLPTTKSGAPLRLPTRPAPAAPTGTTGAP